MTNLCDYGCGREAVIQFDNGKFCCDVSKNRCPALRKKNVLGQDKNGGVWNKGKTKDTDLRVKNNCEKANHTRAALLKLGKIRVWNKGQTKETHPTLQKYSEEMKKRLCLLQPNILSCFIWAL